MSEHEIKHLKFLSEYSRAVIGAAWCSGIIKLDNEEPMIFHSTKEIVGDTVKKGPARYIVNSLPSFAYTVIKSLEN
jgi:hypothetical protein